MTVFALEFPIHPIRETGKRPAAGCGRNLVYIGLVEALYGYPIDGVVVMIGGDKTMPAYMMAVTTGNPPAVGPMLDVWLKAAMGGLALLRSGDRVRVDFGKGTIDDAEPIERRHLLNVAGVYAFPG